VNLYIYFYFTQILLLVIAVLLKKNWIGHVAVLLAILFSGLRFNVGVDYEGYLKHFQDLSHQNVQFYEPATVILSKLLLFPFVEEWLIFLIYALFTISGIYYFFKKFSPRPEFSFFLFLTIPIYYLATFNGVHQWCSISLFAIALVLLLQRKKIWMFLVLAVAVMFHLSALGLLFLLPFLRTRCSLQFLVFFSLGILVISPVFLQLVELTHYYIYLDGIRFNTSPSLVFPIYLFLLLFFPFFLGYFDRSIKLGDKEVILCNMSLASVILISLGYKLGIDFLTFMRANNYLIIALSVLVVFSLEKLSGSLKAILFTLVVSFSLIYLGYTLFINGERYKLVPYNIWNLI